MKKKSKEMLANKIGGRISKSSILGMESIYRKMRRKGGGKAASGSLLFPQMYIYIHIYPYYYYYYYYLFTQQNF